MELQGCNLSPFYQVIRSFRRRKVGVHCKFSNKSPDVKLQNRNQSTLQSAQHVISVFSENRYSAPPSSAPPPSPLPRLRRNSGHRAQGTGHRAQGTGHRVHRAQGAQGTGHRAQGTGHRAQVTVHRTQGTSCSLVAHQPGGASAWCSWCCWCSWCSCVDGVAGVAGVDDPWEGWQLV
jgi:hypothetical protein